MFNSKIHNLRFGAVNRDIFYAIKKGEKKVETRAATVKFGGIKGGDWLVFSCGREKLKRVVKKARIFKTMNALFKTYSPKEINPRCRSKAEAIKMYYSFPRYKEKIKKFGIIAIEIK